MVNLPTSQKGPPENLKVTALNAVTVICRYPKVIHSNQDSDCFKGHWYHSSMVPTCWDVGQTACHLLMNMSEDMSFLGTRNVRKTRGSRQDYAVTYHKWIHFDPFHFRLLALYLAITLHFWNKLEGLPYDCSWHDHKLWLLWLFLVN